MKNVRDIMADLRVCRIYGPIMLCCWLLAAVAGVCWLISSLIREVKLALCPEHPANREPQVFPAWLQTPKPVYTDNVIYLASRKARK